MGMIYDVVYRYANGKLQAGFDPNVARAYVARMIGCKSDGTYAIARNTNGDGHYICIDPTGRVVSHDDLPWVVADREAEQQAARKRKSNLLKRGYAILKQRETQIEAVRDDMALVSVDRCAAKWIALTDIEDAANQSDTGDVIVPFYRALRDAITQTSQTSAAELR